MESSAVRWNELAASNAAQQLVNASQQQAAQFQQLLYSTAAVTGQSIRQQTAAGVE